MLTVKSLSKAQKNPITLPPFSLKTNYGGNEALIRKGDLAGLTPFVFTCGAIAAFASNHLFYSALSNRAE